VDPTLRSLLDTNVLTSALISTDRPESTVTRIVRAGIARAYTLLVPEHVLAEMIGVVATTPYLATRTSLPAAERFATSLRLAAEELPPLAAPPRRVSRDPDDDHLLAYAAAGRADFLVTGDKDQLVLAGDPFPFRIVSPAEFLAVLEEAGLA